MASASSSSAKNLFSESKRRLADRVTGNVNSAASVARQIVRGSRSNEVSTNNQSTHWLPIKRVPFHLQLLLHAAKNFAQQDSTIENSYQNLKKMELLRQHMGYQCESIVENSKKLEYLKEQVEAMER